MKTVATVARYLLGVGFVVFGINGFLNFLPPPPLSEEGGQFIGMLAGSGYIIPVKLLEIVGGLLLLLGRYVTLALTLLGPVVVNIVLFHVAFDPATIATAALFAVLWILVFWDRRDSFRCLWAA
jgi:uncharacterized membrane protein YphA (DoxX/SURF4 family)